MATAESTAAPEPVHRFEYDPDAGVCYLRLDSLDFPGYRVGDDGSVWSCWARANTSKGSAYRIGTDWIRLKIQIYPSGYHYVPVRANGRKRLLRVGRLVLLAFAGPCPPGMECCHNDGNKSNNHIWNLRWDTKIANAADRNRHGVKRGRAGARNPSAKPLRW